MHFFSALQLEQKRRNADMTVEILQNGSEIAFEVRDSAENNATPTTLADLLAIWVENPPREAAMLRNTCVRLADYHRAPVREVTIDEVEQERKGFRPYLEGRKYSENSIRTYVNHVRILVNYASAAGWQPVDRSSPEWNRVVQLAAEHKCADLARHLLTIRNHPREVTSEDVDQWVLATARHSAYQSTLRKKLRFWRILRDCGYITKLPKCLLREKNYGIPIQNFPADLKKEVSELLKWKQAFYVWDRPRDARHRPPTARRLAHVISALYGFAVNMAGETEISSLSDLAQRHIVGGFIQWCITEREVKGQTLQRNLRLLDGVLRQHPRYVVLNLGWFKKLLDGIPVESAAVLQKQRAERVLEYAVIEKIPDMIRAQRPKAAKKGPKKLALLVRDELMIRWLSVLPWRQRNVRECRIGGSNPNLFKGPVAAITTIDMPPWARDERKTNTNAEFWQFHFTEEETKTGCTVDALVPRQLIEPLEEYINTYRAHLLCGYDPCTLFLNQAGRPMSLNQVTGVVSTNTLRYGGRRVTPHPFRDIVAFAWLKAHSKDYLTLSKMLWHSNPNEVIKTYGSLFNESSGVCSMEAWLEERKTTPGK
jgi:integrase